MKWFGEPWPSAKWRAPVCADESERVTPPPPWELCTMCSVVFLDSDQGVVIPHLTADGEVREGYIHLKCLVSSVGGFV
jgi:hypothetical protein